LDRTFAAVWSASFVAMCCSNLASPILPLFFKGLGGSVVAVGLVFSLRDIAQVFLRIPFGSFSDKVGRKKVIAGGVVFHAMAQLAFLLSWDPLLVTVGMLLNGVGMAMLYPAAQTYASELAQKGRLAETMGLYTMAISTGYLIGPLAGGFLAEAFPSYRPVFLISLVLTSIGGGVSILSLKETRPPQPSVGWTEQAKDFGRQVLEVPGMLSSLLRNKRVAAPSAAVFASTFALAALESYYPLYAKSIGYSESGIGIALAIRALLWTFSMPFLGRVSDRIGRTGPMLTGLLLYAVSSALIPLVGGYGSFLLIALLGFGEGILSPASMAGVAENVVAKHRGAAMGIFGTMLMGGRAAGLLTMGGAVGLFGLVSVFYMSAAIAFICAMVVLAGSAPKR